MKVYIERIIFKNRAPFEHLDLELKENQIAVLTAVNGSGKTTLLSHIADAWHEMARQHFSTSFEGKENKYYRLTSDEYSLKKQEPSLFYLRCHIFSNIYIDYLDIMDSTQHKLTQEQYDTIIPIEGKIPFDQIGRLLSQDNSAKLLSQSFIRKETAKDFFNENVITYFPSYRYEMPGYLNDPYKKPLRFSTESKFSGTLNNPIEVVSELPQLANWIMDIMLDEQLHITKREGYRAYIADEFATRNNINDIIRKMLRSNPNSGNLCLGFGRRNMGRERIAITYQHGGNVVYPSIFNMSSGESSILCLFGEILRQADNNKTNISLKDITGIVLIDEVDKHLHIRLQKEVLPELFALFPNVQFIVSSHAPFLNMGLAENNSTKERSTIIDLDNMGISTDPTSNQLYQEVYKMMIGENQRFKESYDSLKSEMNKGTKPLIITEGKTDVKHLKAAKERLGYDLDIDFYEIEEDWGDSKLKQMIEYLSKIPQPRKIIGVFDRDNTDIIRSTEDNPQLYKDYGNNVYAFCIPLVNKELYGESISIEHYYKKDDLLKEDNNGRRLFLGKEFYESQNSIDAKYQTRTSKLQHKIEVNGIIDEKVYQRDDLEQKNSIALSKNDFAEHILNNDEFSHDFDFSNFQQIFDKITSIINNPPTP